MKKIILLFLFTSFTTNIYSQIANEHQVAFLPQGFALQTLSSLGTSNIINEFRISVQSIRLQLMNLTKFRAGFLIYSSPKLMKPT